MKILFIGDYSNLHTTLAHELRRMGHQVDVISDGCGHMNLPTDIFLKRNRGIKGAFKYLYDLFNLLPRMKGYDVVQLINTNFLSLKPQKIKYFFDRIREQNGSMFLTLAGNDYYFCKACYNTGFFRYSEFKIGNEFTPSHKNDPSRLYGWLSNANKLWAEYLMDNITGAMAVLPEYFLPVKEILGHRLTFTNLPVDLSEVPVAKSHFVDDKVNIMMGMRSGFEDMKGVKQLLKIAREVEEDFPEMVKVNIAKDLPFKDFLQMMSDTDIVLDQLYSYSPGMTALYGMAMGKLVATGAQPEYYEAIGNPDIKPIFSLSPFDTDIKERLSGIIHHRQKILKMGEDARRLVEENNDSRTVAKKFLNHWEKQSWGKIPNHHR